MSDYAVGRHTIRSAATSANVGPGFDSLALCLVLCDHVTAEVRAGATEVVVTGQGAGILPVDDSHLVVRSMRQVFDLWGLPQPGLRLACRNAIPQGRGLGSSAAAIVAGVRLAAALVPGSELSDSGALRLAASLEGHPDNVAACLLGGLTIAWNDGAGPSAVRLDVHSSVVPVVLCAEVSVPTGLARGLLPHVVTHQDASSNSARAALLVAALTLEPELLLPATLDVLHQEARRRAMPHSMDLVDMLRASGIAAVLSGAGPSVLALCIKPQVHQAAELAPPGWRVLREAVDPRGARSAPDPAGGNAAAWPSV